MRWLFILFFGMLAACAHAEDTPAPPQAGSGAGQQQPGPVHHVPGWLDPFKG